MADLEDMPVHRSPADTPGKIWLADIPVSLRFVSTASFSVQELKELESYLNDTELDQVQAARSESVRRLRLVSRGMLRRLLALKTGADPAELVIERTKYGKPFLGGVRDQEVRFNIAHSHEWILIGMADAQPADGQAQFQLGVDLEHINPALVTERLIVELTSEKERRDLSTLTESERLKSFFELWVRKESLLKAFGTGVSDLSNILDSNLAGHSYNFQGRFCRTKSVAAPDGYAAAVTVVTPEGYASPWSVAALGGYASAADNR